MLGNGEIDGFLFHLSSSRKISSAELLKNWNIESWVLMWLLWDMKIYYFFDLQWCYWNAEKCDLFKGTWIPNPSGPIYDNESCAVVEAHQNCMKNGRPDSEYLYWRWKPQDCELPQFNSVRFLEAMRNKSWAFIGDSISRNHVQSLLCILSKVCFLFTVESFQFSCLWIWILKL